jgi:class 3 adenylate cyclase/tetratricopeptide (TPR) repeat protein
VRRAGEGRGPPEQAGDGGVRAFPAPVPPAERRIVTVLFADLVDFTGLSERLDSEDVATIQEAYFDAVRETVVRYGGRLEKFIGDAAMAVFGVPAAADRDVERAVRAGLAIVGAVERVEARLGLEAGTLRVRVGVNSGEVVAGAATPDRGAVTGDVVNAAARLQSAAAPGAVLVGRETALAVADAFALDDAGRLTLKGKVEPVPAWVVRAPLERRSRDRAMGRLRAATVGRTEELAALGLALERTAGGVSERIVIAAPPGVGKTRLVEEFAERCGDARVLRARLRPDVLAPYDAVVQLLLGGGTDAAAVRSRVASAAVPPARAAVVADAADALLTGRTRDRGRGSAADRAAVFDAWLTVLDALAGDATGVWIVEDVHWAGPDLLAFLQLAGTGEGGLGSPRLVVATTRPRLLEHGHDWCATGALMHLRPLSRDDAFELVRALTGDVIPPPLVARIVERSDGNPLFIEELLRTWVSTGMLMEEGGGWRLGAGAEDVVLPTTVQAIYSAQLDDLAPDARTVARRASVVGRRFALSALEPLGIEQPAAGIATLRARALLAGPAHEQLFGETYTFRHALLRDAGYASLTRGERAHLHVRLAYWMETAAGEQWPRVAETIARHFATAAETAPALAHELAPGLDRAAAVALAAAWFERGAEAALATAAHEAARQLLERAVDLTAAGAPLDRGRRLRRLGEITAYGADMEDGARTVEQAVELLRDAGEAASCEYRIAVASLAAIWIEQIRFPEAHELVERALADGAGDDEGTARLLISRGWTTAVLTHTLDTARRDSARAAAIAARLGNEQLRVDALSWLAQLHVPARDLLLTDWAEIEQHARGRRSWKLAAAALECRALAALVDDRPRDALRAADALDEAAVAYGLTEFLGWSDYIRTEAYFALGELQAALEAALAALDVAGEHGYARVFVRTWMAAMPLAAALRRRDIGGRFVEWHDTNRSAFPDSALTRIAHASWDVNRVRLGFPGRPVPPPDLLLPSFSMPWSHGSLAVQRDDVVSAWLAAGELAGAAEAVARVERLDVDQPRSIRAATTVLRARVAAAAGDPPVAATLAREALVTFRDLGHRWWIGTTEAFLASCPNESNTWR